MEMLDQTYIVIANPGERENKPDSVQYPLEGYKCLGGNCMLFFSKGFSQFLVFCDSFYGIRH